jgi:hypothetical protein
MANHKICLIIDNFSVWSFNYAPRSCNKVAHALLAMGCKRPPNSDWACECIPAEAEGLVTSDAAESLS